MFQAMDYLAFSGSAIPAFPTTVGDTVSDGHLVWTCIDPAGQYLQADTDQYFVINPNISTQ
jgi:hypothetical protein